MQEIVTVQDYVGQIPCTRSRLYETMLTMYQIRTVQDPVGQILCTRSQLFGSL